MDLPTVLRRDLLWLGSSVGLGHDAIHAPLIALVADLWTAVPSYRGLYLTIVENDIPSAWPRSPQPSRRIHHHLAAHSLRHARPGFNTESHVVFYAATPGAFVDLAADLGHALQTQTSIPSQPMGPTRSEGDGQNDEGQYGPLSGRPPTDRPRHRPSAAHPGVRTDRSGRVGNDQPGCRDPDRPRPPSRSGPRRTATPRGRRWRPTSHLRRPAVATLSQPRRSAMGWFEDACSLPGGATLQCAAFLLTHPAPHAVVNSGQNGPLQTKEPHRASGAHSIRPPGADAAPHH